MKNAKHIRLLSRSSVAVALLCAGLATTALRAFADEKEHHHGNPHSATNVMWLNHFALLPGDSSVLTSFNAVNSGVGGGLTALVVQSTTLGEDATGGGNKVVHMAVQVPPGFDIVGVRVCYELTSSNSFISQIRLAQVQDPPATALVILDDGTDLVNPGPVCVNSQSTLIQPEAGSVLLSLRVKFGNLADKIAIRGLALLVRAKADPDEH